MSEVMIATSQQYGISTPSRVPSQPGLIGVPLPNKVQKTGAPSAAVLTPVTPGDNAPVDTMEVFWAWETRRRLLAILSRLSAPTTGLPATTFPHGLRYHTSTVINVPHSENSTTDGSRTRVEEITLALPPSRPVKQSVEDRYQDGRRQPRRPGRGNVRRQSFSGLESADKHSRGRIQDLPTAYDPEIENILAEAEETAGRAQPTDRDGQQVSSDKSSTRPKAKKEPWQLQKHALKEKFKDGWNPRKKLSPDTIEGIRALHEQYPDRYTTPVLAQEFKVSPEAIRRMLKSKWKPPPEKIEERRERWAKRHDKIWDHQAELGLRPKRTTTRATENPDAFEEDLRAKELLAKQG